MARQCRRRSPKMRLRRPARRSPGAQYADADAASAARRAASSKLPCTWSPTALGLGTAPAAALAPAGGGFKDTACFLASDNTMAATMTRARRLKAARMKGSLPVGISRPLQRHDAAGRMECTGRWHVHPVAADFACLLEVGPNVGPEITPARGTTHATPPSRPALATPQLAGGWPRQTNMPPEASIRCALIQPLPGDSSAAIAAPMSSGMPARPSAVCDATKLLS